MYILICFGLTKRTVLLLLFVMVENLKNALDTNNEKEIWSTCTGFTGAHGGRGGAPFEHGQGCGQHRRPGQRAGSRGGDARRTDGETRNILQIGEEPVGIRQLNDDLPVNHHLQIVYGKRERHRITSEAVQEVMGHNLDMLCNIRLFI